VEENKEKNWDECRKEKVGEAIEDIIWKDHHEACEVVVAKEED
jgi:hypothetical protein